MNGKLPRLVPPFPFPVRMLPLIHVRSGNVDYNNIIIGNNLVAKIKHLSNYDYFRLTCDSATNGISIFIFVRMTTGCVQVFISVIAITLQCDDIVSPSSIG